MDASVKEVYINQVIAFVYFYFNVFKYGFLNVFL